MEKESAKTALLESNNAPEEEKSQRAYEELDLKQDKLELVISKTKRPYKIDGVVIGKLVGFGDAGKPLVDLHTKSNNHPLPARSTVHLDKENIGREIALMFDEGDPHRPIIMGIIYHHEEGQPMPVDIDGESKIITAKKEIVLRCGKASITLTRAGKVIIRGTYLLNRSSGVNKIKGGSVQIN